MVEEQNGESFVNERCTTVAIFVVDFADGVANQCLMRNEHSRLVVKPKKIKIKKTMK